MTAHPCDVSGLAALHRAVSMGLDALEALARGQGDGARAPEWDDRAALDRAVQWVAQRFELQGLDAWGRRVLAFLVGVWTHPEARKRLSRLYPGTGSGAVPFEAVRHALDPSGEATAEVWRVVEESGVLSRLGWIRRDDAGFLWPGPAWWTRRARTAQRPGPDEVALPPWVVPMSGPAEGGLQAWDGAVPLNLDEVQRWWRHRDQVLVGWGFGQRLGSSGPGVKALFSGPPGSGKRRAAAWMGVRLGLEMWSVSTPRLSSRYIGEAEARLAQVFSMARERGVGLFIGDCEDFLGHRTAVRSANDRYANLTVDAFLQEMDSFPGLLILASSGPERLDRAVMRRVNVHVRFALPHAETRAALWEALARSGPGRPLTRAQSHRLAAEFAFSASEIESCYLAAVTWALDRGEALSFQHLWDACMARAEGRGDLVRAR